MSRDTHDSTCDVSADTRKQDFSREARLPHAVSGRSNLSAIPRRKLFAANRSSSIGSMAGNWY